MDFRYTQDAQGWKLTFSPGTEPVSITVTTENSQVSVTATGPKTLCGTKRPSDISITPSQLKRPVPMHHQYPGFISSVDSDSGSDNYRPILFASPASSGNLSTHSTTRSLRSKSLSDYQSFVPSSPLRYQTVLEEEVVPSSPERGSPYSPEHSSGFNESIDGSQSQSQSEATLYHSVYYDDYDPAYNNKEWSEAADRDLDDQEETWSQYADTPISPGESTSQDGSEGRSAQEEGRYWQEVENFEGSEIPVHVQEDEDDYDDMLLLLLRP